MDGDRELFRRGKQLFELASELDRAQRDEFLVSQCGGDQRLRQHVEQLLEADAIDADAIESDALDEGAAAVELAELRSRRIGNYRIVSRIGHGGMGTVYEAEQESPKRSVALKLMHQSLESARARRRFEFEVEVLARLQHPGIAHVYDAGTVEIAGRATPYFAMELVRDARTITDFAAEHALTLRQRIELFSQACDAVQHGHQNGVVHRDLKPANLLVDAGARVKVIDFGVARSTNADVTLTTLQTRAGELLGTLGYMSPEQCDADPSSIDTRSDVYSLGVVLYELLCGGAPYDLSGLSIAAATRVIRELPPRAPSSIRPALEGNLEAILLKALHKDRERRYASPSALSDDLRRHTAGQAIEARLPDCIERFVGWARRHPVVLTTSVCAGIASFTALAMWFGIWWFGSRPARIEVDQDGSSVVLLSRAGVELYRWDLGAKGAVAGAHLIEAAAGSRDGDLVVIGATWTARWSYGGHLCAFRVDAPGELAWSSSADRIVPPPDLHDRPEARFAIERIWVEDVFEECPGPEIVAAQRLSEYAATAMCVFDSTGRVRYRVWNDGPISGLAWLSAAHRLIATSSDTETRWDAAVAQPAVPHPRYPAIAFAVEPVLDRCANDWIARSGAVRDETLRWYRWLGPSESLAGVAGLRCQVLGDVGELDPKSHVAIGFAPDTEDPTLIRAMVDFLLDADGRVVRQWTTDDWKVAEQARRVPDAARLTLLPYEALQR